jgi:hypothetical protein
MATQLLTTGLFVSRQRKNNGRKLMSKSLKKFGNPRIAATVAQLQKENEHGDISCLVVIVIRPGGESARIIHGAANSITLLGSIEMLKGLVVSQEVETANLSSH